MLHRLHIRNYAIIDDLAIEFDKGLNIITGETGAGKSILMGALGLVLGNRADTSVLYDPSEKCFVEAVFRAGNNPSISRLLQEMELDEEETLIIRREIAANGKSRSFVNDTPVTLQGLRQIAELLVDLHRQFDTLSLGEVNFQFDVLDALAGQQDLVKQYGEAYSGYKKAGLEYKKLKDIQETAGRELDYTRFLYNELEEANLQPDEIELLENEVKLLSNAESIKSSLGQVLFALDENDPSIVQQIRQLGNQLQSSATGVQELTELKDRLGAVHIELQDIAHELARVHDRVGMDPERLALAHERLSAGYKLLKKHQVHTTQELIELQQSLSEKLMGIENMDERLAVMEMDVANKFREAIGLAKKLSAGRQKVIEPLEKTTAKYLQQMGMPNARMKAECVAVPENVGQESLNAYGTDQVRLLFDANKTSRFEPLEKVASGGELSRLMLAIKAQVAKSVKLPALIFDEIDTGISGEAARQVGLLLRQLAGSHQVISITHQPQIAARADAHFFVYKQEKNGAIKTRLRRLEVQERIDTIAQMLSGETLTDSARQIAREMVGAG